MSWIGKIFGSGIVESAAKIADSFHFSKEERAEKVIALEALLQKRDSEIEQTIRQELASRERVLVAELTQGNAYTKMARPTVVYFGLLVIAINYVVFPMIQYWHGSIEMDPLELPTAFWAGWSGIVMTWSIGRTAERRKTTQKASSLLD